MQGRTLSFDPEDDLEVSTVPVPAANGQPAFPQRKPGLAVQNIEFLAAQLLKSLPFKHTYAPLEPGHVRILTVRKGTGEEPLELDLHARDGQDLPNYQALSYVWGSDPRSHQVILRDFSSPLSARFPPGRNRPGDRLRFVIQRMKGTKTYIRPSLYDALIRVRRTGSDIRVWADALCINQNNAAEKTSQISQLHNLYQKANNVFIWLGNGRETTEVALEFILELVDVDGLATLLKQPKQELETKANALLEMMKSPWFTRRWVIQEIVLARRASIWCGPGKLKAVNWDDFADALTTFKVHVLPALGYAVQDVLAFGAQVLVQQKGYLLRGSGSSMVFTTSLEDLISHLTPFNAGDPRDIVYGVISISREQHSDGWYSPTEPDYRKSLLDVYVEFTESCVKNSGRLDIICRPWVPQFTGLKQDVPIQERVGFYELTVENALPSWMKSLRYHPYGSGEDIYEGRQYGDIFATAKPTYNACGTCQFDETTRPMFGTREARIYVTANIKHRAYITDALGENPELFYETFDGTLNVQGVALGMICELSDTCTSGTIPWRALDMGGWGFPDRNKPQLIDIVPDCLWRTMVANLGPDGNPPPTYYRRACLWALQRLPRAGNLDVRKILSDNPHFLYKDFLAKVDNTTLGRRFFRCAVNPGVTGGNSDGRLFGLCPEGTKEDDIVCILYGCHVPVVLRKRGTCPDFGLTNPTLKGFRSGTEKELQNHRRRRSNRPMSPSPEPTAVVKSFSMPGSFPVYADDTTTEETDQTEAQAVPEPDPRILQKEERVGIYYEVIGECYVYGYMDGEIIKQEPWKTLKTFVLR